VIGVNVQLLGSRRAGEFQKKVALPSNIVDKGGGTIQRCWHWGQGHGGMQSESLTWVKVGQRPTNSSIAIVPAYHFKKLFSFSEIKNSCLTEVKCGKVHNVLIWQINL
jgi:hypothetical protein